MPVPTFWASAFGDADWHPRLLQDPKLVTEFYAHPLVKLLGQYKRFGRVATDRRPSYVPAKLFALTLLDLVYPASAASPRDLQGLRQAIANAPSQLQQMLAILLDQSARDADKSRESMEQFRESMEQ